MKYYFKFLVFVLAFVLSLSLVQAEEAKVNFLDSLDLSEFNDKQKELIFEEIEKYSQSITPLYATDRQGWKESIKELIGKIRDGLRVYGFARDRRIEERIRQFDSTSNIKVYVLTHIEGAGLNNLFIRLAEAYYQDAEPDSLIIFKYKFDKSSSYSYNNPDYTLINYDVAPSEALKEKYGNIFNVHNLSSLSKPSFSGNIRNELARDIVYENIDETLNWLEDAGVRSTSIESGATHEIVLENLNSGSYLNNPYREIAAICLKVSFAPETFNNLSKEGRKVEMLRRVLTNEKISSCVREGAIEQIPDIFRNVSWITRPSISEPLYYGLEYLLVKSILVQINYESGLNQFYDNTINEYPDYLKDFLIAQRNDGRFAKHINEIVKIVNCGRLMGEKKWKEFHKGESEIENSEEAYYARVKKIFGFYKTGVKESVEDLILKCNDPDKGDVAPDFGMAYLGSLLRPKEYLALSSKHRKHMLQVLVKNLREQQENIALEIIRTCPQQQKDSLIWILKQSYSETEKDGSTPLIVKLNSHTQNSTLGIGENNYSNLMAEILNLIKTSDGFQYRVQRLIEGNDFDDKIVNWQGYTTVDNSNMNSKVGFIWVDEVEMNDKGEFTYTQRTLEKREYFVPGCDFKNISKCEKNVYFATTNAKDVTLSDPFDLVVFVNFDKNEEIDALTGAEKGKIAVLPVFFLNFVEIKKEQENFIKGTSIAIDLATIFYAPATIMKAASRLRTAVVFFELVNASENLAMNLTPLGDIPELNAALDASNTIMLLLGAGQFIKAGVASIDFAKALRYTKTLTQYTAKSVKDAVKNFVTAISGYEQTLLLKITPQNEQIIRQILALRDEMIIKAKKLWGEDWKGLGRFTDDLIQSLPSQVKAQIIAFQKAGLVVAKNSNGFISCLTKSGEEVLIVKSNRVIIKKFLSIGNTTGEIVDGFALVKNGDNFGFKVFDPSKKVLGIDFTYFVSSTNGGFPRVELAHESFYLYMNKSWGDLEALYKINKLNIANGVSWPPANGGFNHKMVYLKKRELFDRYQYSLKRNIDGELELTGEYISPISTNGGVLDFESRALSGNESSYSLYYKFEVIKDIDFPVEVSDVIPWHGHSGLGIQLRFDANKDIGWLIRNNYIKITQISSPKGINID